MNNIVAREEEEEEEEEEAVIVESWWVLGMWSKFCLASRIKLADVTDNHPMI